MRLFYKRISINERDTNIAFPNTIRMNVIRLKIVSLERKQQIIGRGVDVNCARRALVILGEKEIAEEKEDENGCRRRSVETGRDGNILGSTFTRVYIRGRAPYNPDDASPIFSPPWRSPLIRNEKSFSCNYGTLIIAYVVARARVIFINVASIYFIDLSLINLTNVGCVSRSRLHKFTSILIFNSSRRYS